MMKIVDRMNMKEWQIVDKNGAFLLENPQHTNLIYFPLVNETGFTAVVTPTLHGDIKADHHSYLMPPVSVEDLHTSRAARNFWVVVEGQRPWSATGNSAWQLAQRFTPREENTTLTAGPLWHQLTRENQSLGLRVDITNFVPASQDRVELMRVTLVNISDETLTLTPTAAIPIYGRSADNLRDHRHVTSLLHRIDMHRHGVLVKPTLSFDERGHKPNALTYAVLGTEADGSPPVAFWPIVEDFIGQGGTLDWPQAVVVPAGEVVPDEEIIIDGYEAMGALRFQSLTLQPGDSHNYVLLLAILDEDETPDALLANYGNAARFESWLLRTRQYWADKLDALQFHTGDDRFNGWLRWVTLQPSLRRLCGNSYLPYHDYGHGGRGWRDLWQDLLALLMIEPVDVRPLLYSNFAGVRVDGSNATIIGSSPGDFRADRNNIPRVWMDHGAWPLQTTQLYIDYTGDLSFLLRDQVYFKDSWLRRAQTFDETWRPEDGSEHRTAAGDVYQGTILEHLLIQHLTAFFNVGEHNIIKLEGADWNDGLDMAQERGESVAFTALYAGNLKQLSKLAMQLTELGITEIFLAVDLKQLLDTFGDPVDYTSPSEKQQRLAEYFTAVQPSLSGEKMSVTLRDLAADLATKANWLSHHLQRQEWIDNEAGFSWFNGYYDDDGYRVEGDHPDGVRMTLTGQTFALMGDITTHDQAAEIVRAVDHYLYDAAVGGYRLNTDFGEVSLNLGRCFGFAFGHKENGAMFSHMAVMYANALYRRGLVREGNKVLVELYSHSQNFAVSRMYPGIPEYVNARGRGMYPYLTGSASWFLLTLLAEVFGIKGQLGDLLLQPKLLREQFDVAGKATVVTQFADRKLRIIYNNPAGLDHGDYHIAGVKVNGEVASCNKSSDGVIIDRSVISSLNLGPIHDMDVMLKADVN